MTYNSFHNHNISPPSFLSAEGLNYCNKLFQFEQEWDESPVEKRYQKQQEEIKPIMNEFFN